MNKVLYIHDLHFAYDKREILCSIDLNVIEKDFFIISGDNGSGKSTLIKLILGLLEPNIGHIHLDTNKIGYVPQTGLQKVKDFPANVYEVVAMRLDEVNFFNLKKKSIQEKVFKALELVNIENLAYKRISDLSGGQLQRVLIARELVMPLDILLLDEPTNGLDQKSIASLMETLTELNQQGLTIGMVSHYVEDIKAYTNRIFEIKDKHLFEVKQNV